MLRIGIAGLAALLVGSVLHAQGLDSSITGFVSDPSGAAIAGASVTAAHLSTGVVNQTTTNESGVYTFPALPIGAYTLHVEARGFKTRETRNLVVQTGQALRADAILGMSG